MERAHPCVHCDARLGMKFHCVLTLLSVHELAEKAALQPQADHRDWQADIQVPFSSTKQPFRAMWVTCLTLENFDRNTFV